jgi:hypothetical protein
MLFKRLLMVVPVLALAACKIEIVMPEEGGSVVVESGEMDSCGPGETCIIEVTDQFFDQNFVAEPAEGYKFVHWKKRHRSFCGGNEESCHLYTTTFNDHEGLVSFLNSPDEVFYLEPVFEPEAGEPTGEPVCHFNEQTPGGSFEACRTRQDEQSCGELDGTLSIGSCLTGDPIGYCSIRFEGDTYYYGGDVATLRLGCENFAGGTWTDI